VLDPSREGDRPMLRPRASDAAKYRGKPKLIAEYLNNALTTGDVAIITKAIGDMVRAQGVSRISQKVDLSREGLYRSFGGQMGPGFDTVLKVLLALEIRLVAKPCARLGELGMTAKKMTQRKSQTDTARKKAFTRSPSSGRSPAKLERHSKVK
jgi:probable addiction module antidote protein